MTGRHLVLIACFTAIFTPACGQRLSIELNGGLQGTQYRLAVGSARMLPGGTIGLLYAFPLQDRLDLLAGITAGVYRTQVRLPDGAAFTDYQVDDEGSAFEYNMRTKGYKETQQFFAAGVPLLLQYHTAVGGTQWYVNAGGKLLFPESDRIDISAEQISLTGYYPDYNIMLSDLPKHGFGTLNGWKAGTSTRLKPAAALSASTGIGFPLPHGMLLSVGLFAEYGLTGLKSGNDSMPLFTYSPTGVSGTKANGVLEMPNTGRMNLLAFGIQVRLSLGPARRKSAAGPAGNKQTKEAPAPPAQAQETPVPAQAPPAQAQETGVPAQAPPVKNKATGTQPPPAPIPANPTPGMSINDWKVMQTPVLFGALGEISLSDMAKSHLDEVAAIMLQNPNLRISITGHICNSGTATESKKIGEIRAKAVAEYLRRKGVDRKKMEISYSNGSDPVVPNNPAANYLKRRVVISVK